MQINQSIRKNQPVTHGGAPAFPHLSKSDQLRRSVMSCLLWEDSFYEDGQSIADRIATLAMEAPVEDVKSMAIEARSAHNLRHAPLMLLLGLVKRGGSGVAETIAETIQRPDELCELLALYWRDGKKPLAKQLKKGLALAFTKFDAYQLAKYNRDKAVKLRDVLFMCHAKPKDEAQAQIWENLVNDTLQTPDTWETNLSGGADKAQTFERLLREGKLGYMALLRNLRNMVDSGVPMNLVRESLLARKGAGRVLPFRYVAAARACPRLEPEIDQALIKSIESMPKLTGETAVLVDVSYSMNVQLSSKSDMTRMDAACALASLINAESLRVFSFSNRIVEVPPRRGMAGVDAIKRSQAWSCTDLAGAVSAINHNVPHDRFIVITDEQATTGRVHDPICDNGYMINVASYQNGVGYGKWTHLDGFSESVIKWIYELESI